MPVEKFGITDGVKEMVAKYGQHQSVAIANHLSAAAEEEYEKLFWTAVTKELERREIRSQSDKKD